MILPTNIGSPMERLRKCQEIFVHLKGSNLYKYDKSVLFQNGTWFNPLRFQWLKNTTFPLILTNIASDREGFSIGNSPVSEFTMTCAPLPGACGRLTGFFLLKLIVKIKTDYMRTCIFFIVGVIICGFSYKDVIELSATAKEGILNEVETQKLADLMGKEIEILRKLV